jgi:transcriptional regulator with XRE-family HTH domain
MSKPQSQTIKAQLIERIITHQKLNGLTDSELARRCGCNPSIIFLIKKDSVGCPVSIDKLLNLTEALGYPYNLIPQSGVKVTVNLEATQKNSLEVSLSDLGKTPEQWAKMSKKQQKEALNGFIGQAPAVQWELSNHS